MKNKKEAFLDARQVIINSWTWERLTDKEQNNFINVLASSKASKIIKGNYKERYNIIMMLYDMFLEGTGYEPTGWR